MPNKILTVLILFTVLLVSSCEEKTTSSKGSLSLGPKMNSISGNPSFSLISEPRNDFIPYTITNDFDNAHRTFVPIADWIVFIARASAPVFSGFEKVDYEDGDTFDTDYYNKSIRTTVHRSTDTTSFDGVFNDGGYYHLIINVDNTYTYEQYTITDYVLVEPSLLSLPIDDPNRVSYVQKVLRLAIYSTAQGTINNTDSDGTGTSIVMEFIPGQAITSNVLNATEFDLTVNPSDCWTSSVIADVYNFQTKSRDNFFGIRNSVPGQLCYFYSQYGLDYLTVAITKNVVYSNEGLSDIIKTISTHGTEVYDYNSVSPDSDYLVYQLNSVWQPQLFVGVHTHPGMPTQEEIDARLAQINTIWSTY